MRLKKRSSAGFFVVFLFSLSMFILGLRGVKLENITFGGTIAGISEDAKSIAVDGAKVPKIMISPSTKIVDEKGNPLDKNSLRSKRPIEVEGLYNPNGPFYAKKIIVKTPKQNP